MNREIGRRGLLKLAGAGLLVAGASSIVPSAFAADAPRVLAFVNTHTADTFHAPYWENGAYVPDAMAAINHVMRDYRNNEVHDIDPRLLDKLVALNGIVGTSQPYQIISGYRSPQTNAMLHANSDGVASHSLHMEGKAIDIRVQGVELDHLRDAALSLHNGGVGYYPSSEFVHVDTGRPRTW